MDFIHLEPISLQSDNLLIHSDKKFTNFEKIKKIETL